MHEKRFAILTNQSPSQNFLPVNFIDSKSTADKANSYGT